MNKLFEQHSGTAWAGRTGKHKQSVSQSRLQSLLAANGPLEETPPLLLYWLSSRVKRIQCFINFGQWQVTIFMELAKSCDWTTFIGLWGKIWQKNKSAWSKSNPVQSCISKSKTCPRNGPLLKLEWNSTVTLHGGAQKLGKDCWHDSDRLQPKVCSQISCKWNACLKAMLGPALTGKVLICDFMNWAICLWISRAPHAACRRQPLVWLNWFINNRVMDARQAACQR